MCVWCLGDLNNKMQVWNSLRNANGLWHLLTYQVPQPLRRPSPAVLTTHKHPMHTSSPTRTATGATACSLRTCSADSHCIYSTADRTGGSEALGMWKTCGTDVKRRLKGKESWEDAASGAFRTLSHNPFATHWVRELPTHGIRASHLTSMSVWVDLCLVCPGSLLYVKHKSVQSL